MKIFAHQFLFDKVKPISWLTSLLCHGLIIISAFYTNILSENRKHETLNFVELIDQEYLSNEVRKIELEINNLSIKSLASNDSSTNSNIKKDTDIHSQRLFPREYVEKTVAEIPESIQKKAFEVKTHSPTNRFHPTQINASANNSLNTEVGASSETKFNEKLRNFLSLPETKPKRTTPTKSKKTLFKPNRMKSHSYQQKSGFDNKTIITSKIEPSGVPKIDEANWLDYDFSMSMRIKKQENPKKKNKNLDGGKSDDHSNFDNHALINKRHKRKALGGSKGNVINTYSLSEGKKTKEIIKNQKKSELSRLKKKQMLELWGFAVRKTIIERTRSLSLISDTKISLKISKSGNLLELSFKELDELGPLEKKLMQAIKKPGAFPKAPPMLELKFVTFPVKLKASS